MLRSSSKKFAAALSCILIIALQGCAQKVGSGVVPAIKAHQPAHASLAVVRHTVHLDAQRNALGGTHVGGSGYRGNVVTLPPSLISPTDVTYDPDDGNVYVLSEISGQNAYQILKITPAGVATTFAKLGPLVYGIVYDHATQSFYATSPYLPPNDYAGVYAITSAGNVSILAGGSSWGQQDGQGQAASFLNPTGITLDGANGTLYLVDSDRIRAVTPGGAVTTLTQPGSIGGESSDVRAGIVWNPTDGNFYVAAPATDSVQRVASTGAVSVLAGQCVANQNQQCAPLERNGPGTKALFATPTGITVTAAGNLYVADSQNNAIREVTTAGMVSTLAGSGRTGSVDGAGLNAEFSAPTSLTTVGGKLYELDSSWNGGALRTVTTAGSAPPPPSSLITMYETATPGAQPFAIDWRAPAKTLWYTELTGRIAAITPAGQSTEYQIIPHPRFSTPTDIALDGKGTPWFYDPPDGVLSHRSGGGRVTSYKLNYQYNQGPPSLPDSVAYGPGNTMWLTEFQLADSVSSEGVLSRLHDKRLVRRRKSNCVFRRRFVVDVQQCVPHFTDRQDGHAR